MSTSSRKKPRHDDDDDDGGGGGESSSSNSRLAALSIALSSLLLSSGLATVLYVYTESLRDQFDDGDVDEPAQVVAWWTAEAAFKWALISAGGSLSGIVGILVVSLFSLSLCVLVSELTKNRPGTNSATHRSIASLPSRHSQTCS